MLKNLAACFAFVFAPANAGTIAWPDPDIPIPEKVLSYIVAECLEYRGISGETVDECISDEIYAYGVVATILMHEELGDSAAERYRGCAVDIGNLGGRFHRRKAACVGDVYCIAWRFTHSGETCLRHVRKAAKPRPAEESWRDFAFAVTE